MMHGSGDKMAVTNIFLDPENMTVDTKIYLLRVLDEEIQALQGQNGGHFEFMLIRTDAMIW